MRTARIAALGCALALAGCGGQTHQDLREWMAAQGKGVKERLEPLPTIRPYEAFAYNAFDLPDPFKPRKVESKGGKLAPDMTRRREPLESFPLESLSMVGTIEKGRALYALVKTPEKDIYQVRQGNYMGQNYGVVIGISDSDIQLKELIQDGAGDWTEKSSALNLLPSEVKAGSKR
jgi:type IV pilus assembly protein PilP